MPPGASRAKSGRVKAIPYRKGFWGVGDRVLGNSISDLTPKPISESFPVRKGIVLEHFGTEVV